MHLRPTKVEVVQVDKSASPHIPNVKADKPIVLPTSGKPISSSAVKAPKPNSIKSAAKINDVPYRTRSGKEVHKPPCHRDYVCLYVPIIVLNF